MWIVCITSVRHVLTVNGYGGRQTKENEKSWCFKGWETLVNYVMDYRLIHCLRNGLPLDMDVYDAAEWSCITELSEKSVLNKSMAVEIPDFTRGAWKKYKY